MGGEGGRHAQEESLPPYSVGEDSNRRRPARKVVAERHRTLARRLPYDRRARDQAEKDPGEPQVPGPRQEPVQIQVEMHCHARMPSRVRRTVLQVSRRRVQRGLQRVRAHWRMPSPRQGALRVQRLREEAVDRMPVAAMVLRREGRRRGGPMGPVGQPLRDRLLRGGASCHVRDREAAAQERAESSAHLAEALFGDARVLPDLLPVRESGDTGRHKPRSPEEGQVPSSKEGKSKRPVQTEPAREDVRGLRGAYGRAAVVRGRDGLRRARPRRREGHTHAPLQEDLLPNHDPAAGPDGRLRERGPRLDRDALRKGAVPVALRDDSHGPRDRVHELLRPGDRDRRQPQVPRVLLRPLTVRPERPVREEPRRAAQDPAEGNALRRDDERRDGRHMLSRQLVRKAGARRRQPVRPGGESAAAGPS